MKKVCGYKSKSGRFFKKKSDCELADLEYDLKRTALALDSFYKEIDYYLFKHGSHESQMFFNKYKDEVFEVVSRRVLKDSDKFIQIINNKKKLESKLDKLHAQVQYHKWWNKFKWW